MTQRRTEPAIPAPFQSGPYAIRPDWIDSNGHLNLAYYILLFDRATDAIWQPIGLGDSLRAQRFGTFAAETHTLYRAELLEEDSVIVASQLIAGDAKRLHVAHEMRRARDGVISAQQELMYLCVDLGTRRVSPWPQSAGVLLRAGLAAHVGLAPPDWLARQVAMPTRAASSPGASSPAPAA